MKHLNCSSTQSQIRNPQSAIRSFSFFLLPFYFLLLIACEKNTTSVAPPDPQLTLTIEDVAVTEAYLTLTVQDRTENLRFALLRDDSLILHGPLTTDDTTLYDANLLPARGYTYRAELQKEGQKIAVAGPLSITTLDTTSHNFTWQIDTIGDGNSSVLRDVFIIDENDIWAVGEIYLKDSTGQLDPEPYGAVHWNGIEWEILKVPYRRFGTNNILPGALKAVYGFNSSDVYVASSAVLLKKNGPAWEEKAFFMTGIPFNGQVTKIWGSSESNLYCVGKGGAIYYHNDHNWSRIPSGTDLPIQDIWGAADSKTGETTILCPASEKYYASEKKIIQIDPETKRISFKDWPFPNARTLSIWFKNKRSIWICGGGVYAKRGDQWKKYTELPAITLNRIRGMAHNDIFVVGDFGLVAHFNGLTWKVFPEVNVALYRSVDYKPGLMVAVGGRNARGIILRMRR